MGLGLGLRLSYFILNSPRLTCDETCSRLYADGKVMRRKCHMINLSMKKHFLRKQITIPQNNLYLWTILVKTIHCLKSTTAQKTRKSSMENFIFYAVYRTILILLNTWVEKIYRKIKLRSIETHSLVQAWETYHCLPGTLNTY